MTFEIHYKDYTIKQRWVLGIDKRNQTVGFSDNSDHNLIPVVAALIKSGFHVTDVRSGTACDTCHAWSMTVRVRHWRKKVNQLLKKVS